MARLPYVNPDEAPEHVAAALSQLPDINVIRIIAHASEVFNPWVQFANAVLNKTALDPILREISILRVAALSPGADYEWSQHEVIAREVGTTETQIEGARTGVGLSGDDELVSRFTEEVVRDVSPTESTWGQAYERFTPRELVELLLVIGHYMMIARIVATTQVEPDAPVGAGLFDDLKEAGR